MKEKKKLSLPAWIFIGMLAGIVAGLIFAFAGLGDFTTEWIKPVGTIYVNLLKFLVVPVVLFSIADGVISLKDLKRVGSVGVKTFVYYMCTTALAVVIGLVLVNLFKGSFTPLPSADLGALEYEAKEAPSVMQVIVNIFPSNLLQPMVSSDMLPVIVIAIFLGAGVLASGEKGQKIAELINCMEEVIMKIMMMIIKFTPIGVFCTIVPVVEANGTKTIVSLATQLIILYVAFYGFAIVVYGGAVKLIGKTSPVKFFKAIMPAALNAFGTCSSSATIPISKRCVEKELGVSNQISSIAIPLGATVNMDAVSILMSFMIMFFANACGINVSISMMVIILLANVLLSVGTPGIPGGAIASFAALATMAGLPAGVMGVYISINTLCDMGATCVNVIGDMAGCVVLQEKIKLEEN